LSIHNSRVTGHDYFPLFYFFIDTYKKKYNFAFSLVARKGVKRESGESPEQSRCCKFSRLPIKQIATAYRHRYVGRLNGNEQVRRPAKSEKSAHFRGKSARRSDAEFVIL